MRPAKWLATSASAITLAVLAPQVACADCLGFFNRSEQGYNIEGDRLEPTGETVAAGTELKFNGLGTFRNKSYLLRSRSEMIDDAQNVELTSGCDLPLREPPRAK